MSYFKDLAKNKYAKLIALLAVLSLLFNISLSFVMVEGDSMDPYYTDKEVVFVDKLSYRFAPIERFDIVIIETKEGERLIKRVIAMAGETLRYTNQNFYINEKPLTSDFYNYHRSPHMEIPSMKVPKDHFFVIGDNRDYSMFSLFHKSQIVGKVIF
jgi:signal peptidase I|tara:strand:+ start:797 stop:1264 length:468 start_codon:yes stop_codon:yes gene_type:complete